MQSSESPHLYVSDYDTSVECSFLDRQAWKADVSGSPGRLEGLHSSACTHDAYFVNTSRYTAVQADYGRCWLQDTMVLNLSLRCSTVPHILIATVCTLIDEDCR